MHFLYLPFFPFLLFVFAFYWLTGKQHRYLVLLIANYTFYGWSGNFAAIITLLLSTILTYIGGWVLERKKEKSLFVLFFSANILILLLFKYTNFVIDNMNLLLKQIVQQTVSLPQMNLIAPLGLSFYIFQSTTYLSDVYRKGMSAEKNFFRYAAFVSFFPSVLSGPIQKSRDLLPQLKNPASFSFDRAREGIILLIWGYFEKIVVANKLSSIANAVFDYYLEYDNVYYIVAAVSYSFYIYSDFSSYSDMACGVAKLLGYEIKPNFCNPYLAESLSGFWNRWHMTLNSWFIENVYIPLGGNRKGKVRKYINILAVFFISGIWHGASWNFVVWGGFNGILRSIGEMLTPFRKRVYGLLRINEACVSIRVMKRVLVFCIITITWIFFRMPDFDSAIHIVRNTLLFEPIALINSDVFALIGPTKDVVFFLFYFGVFLSVQYMRREDGKIFRVIGNQPMLVQITILAVLVTVCIFSACSAATTFNTQFIYFQF